VGFGVVVLGEVNWTGVVRSCEPGVRGPWAWYDRNNGVCDPLSAYSLTGFGLPTWTWRDEAMTFRADGAGIGFTGTTIGYEVWTQRFGYVCEHTL
jgi:hypothetical protein